MNVSENRIAAVLSLKNMDKVMCFIFILIPDFGFTKNKNRLKVYWMIDWWGSRAVK